MFTLIHSEGRVLYLNLNHITQVWENKVQLVNGTIISIERQNEQVEVSKFIDKNWFES